MKIRISSLREIDDAAAKFVQSMTSCTPSGGKPMVYAFHGTMGAGKTTLISAICRQMGVTTTVSSPTFAIVNEYDTPGGQTIAHFDFYRVGRIDEVLDMGADDYFYSGRICFVEWPDVAENLLPPETVHVYINVEDDGSRTVRF